MPSAPLALILADGEPPPVLLLRDWVRRADGYFATDGALAIALALEQPPQVVLGDLDSLSGSVPPGIEILSIAEQETTDLEKALYTVIELGYRSAVVLGAGGRRWDHFHHNLALFARYSPRLALEAGDAHGWLRLLRPGRHRFPASPGAAISLLPLPTASRVTTSGVRWPLSSADLTFAGPAGICNLAISDEVTIEFAAGALAVYWPADGT